MTINDIDPAVYDAILVGMDVNDAILLSGKDLADVSEEYLLCCRRLQKSLEYSLLTDMKNFGNQDSTKWMLEHLFPRYTQKQAVSGSISITVPKKAPETADVELN